MNRPPPVLTRLPLAAVGAACARIRAEARRQGLDAHGFAARAGVPAFVALRLLRPRWGDPPDIRLDYLRRSAAAVDVALLEPVQRHSEPGGVLFRCPCGRLTERALGPCGLCARRPGGAGRP